MPLLRCVNPSKVGHALADVQKCINDHHLRGYAIARKVLKADYLWLTMNSDAMEYVKNVTSSRTT